MTDTEKLTCDPKLPNSYSTVKHLYTQIGDGVLKQGYWENETVGTSYVIYKCVVCDRIIYSYLD
jgi:hypothetical protein